MSKKRYHRADDEQPDVVNRQYLSRAKFLSFSQMLEGYIGKNLVPYLKDHFTIEDIAVVWNDKKMCPGMVNMFLGVEGDDDVIFCVSQMNGGTETFLADLVANARAIFGEDELPF